MQENRPVLRICATEPINPTCGYRDSTNELEFQGSKIAGEDPDVVNHYQIELHFVVNSRDRSGLRSCLSQKALYGVWYRDGPSFS